MRRTLLLLAAGAAAAAVGAPIRESAARAQEMMGSAAGTSVVHDPAYFRDRVLPVLAQHCLGCHDTKDPANETRHRLVAPGADGKFDDAAVQKNYETIRSLMDARSPERSPLLLKLLPTSRGGVDHDGGKADDTGFPRALVDPKGALLAWAFGATPADAPPLAAWAPVQRQVPVGTEVRLDATLSSDPEGKSVSVKWE